MKGVTRLHYLDSLRGIAAVSVICSHFVLGYGLPSQLQWLSQTPIHALWHGEGAVSFFFVLSGFVLALPYLAEKPKQILFLPYAINRFFRIVPLLVFAIFASLFARQFLFHTYQTIPEQSGWVQWFWHQSLTPKGILQLLPQGWTLAVELPMSLIIPFMAVATRKNSFWLVLCAYLLILTMGLNKYVFDFVLGVVLARNKDLMRDIWLSLSNFSRLLTLITGFLLYTAVFFTPQSLYSVLNFIFVDPIGLGCVLILFCVLCSISIQRILSHVTFLFLGKISYSIYLMHFIILLCITPAVVSLLNRNQISDEYSTRLISLAATLVTTIIISVYSYLLVEQPFIRFGKKFGQLLLNFLPLWIQQS
jgi:peptidoglycan/LPS O-acetylase OafA/YrhL